MIKNITAVLFALLLSTAVFAQYPIISTTGTMPGIYTGMPSQSSSSDANLKENNEIAKAFANYRQEAVPSKAATRADMEYESYDHIAVPIPYAPGGFGPDVAAWQDHKINVPAVLLPAPSSNQYQVAFPAALFLRTYDGPDEARHNKISLTFYVKLFQGEINSITILSDPKIAFVKSGCPSGMTLRKAQSAQETDICTVYMNYKANRPKLTQAMKDYFANHPTTPAMAAKALKKIK